MDLGAGMAAVVTGGASGLGEATARGLAKAWKLPHRERMQDMKGMVSFVSSGPGDPELLTMRAIRRLQAADVVLYDDLASGPVLEQAIHELRDEPQVTDIRNLGLAAAIDITPLPGKPGLRAFQIFERALDKGLLVRFTGETLALAPPFVSSEDETRAAVDALRRALRAVPAP